jgi:hypothetical protein
MGNICPDRPDFIREHIRCLEVASTAFRSLRLPRDADRTYDAYACVSVALDR